MNRNNREIFNRIRKAATNYQNDTRKALTTYRQSIENARSYAAKFKDEESIFNQKKAEATNTARMALASAENAFTGCVQAEIPGLKEELTRHLTARPSAAFLDTLRVYNDFGIVPSRSEIEAMIAANEGNALGLRALNAVLDRTGSDVRVSVPDASTYEADIAALEAMTKGGNTWTPNDLHTEAVAVYSGQQRPNGYAWDGVSLITARAGFESKVKGLDGMSERWTSSVVPTVFVSEQYSGGASGAKEYVEDRAATAKAAEVVQNQDAAADHARQMAHERAEADHRAAEIMASYRV